MLLLFVVLGLGAHDLHHSISRAEAVTVHFDFAQEGDFSFQSYELYGPANSEIPFAVGRTDALGRAVFMPHEAGRWTLKAFGEEGHDAVVEIDVDEALHVRPSAPQSSLLERLALGLGVIAAIFGLLHLITQRKTNETL
ncbi:MAG: hypothetical protein JXK05_11435 [Campylobacterales bacterium]|nr:hypothetical protein [Campylobacterales bacterium]